MDMPLHPTWPDIALRLILTVLACALIGLNREAKGHSAGLRTTILVGLAASVAMIEANILLGTSGKTPDSFANLDPMRLVLGILTGMGFIGGGAILRRGNVVAGVTTAATLWVVTVVGLCFGGGQLVLGGAATVLVITVLSTLKWLDLRIPRDHRAELVIRTGAGAPSLAELRNALNATGCAARFLGEAKGPAADLTLTTFELRWKQREIAGPPSEIVRCLKERFDVQSFAMIAEGDR
jgi:putative Mg2+ transporter-C (MgtC) family protein